MFGKWSRVFLGFVLAAVAVVAFVIVRQSTPALSASAPEPAAVSAALPEPTLVPAPAVDEPIATGAGLKTIMLAGGCFWGVQGLFQHIDGVVSAESGYTGGDRQDANYKAVSHGGTGHAESVRITYDPAQVSYGQLLRVFFAVVMDPTQLSRQGNDHGSQYRTAIFTESDTQARVARAYINQLDTAAIFPGPIVTTVSPGTEFFPAERYHQDYMTLHPTEPYIASAELPKLAELKRVFPQQYRDRPALMFPNG